MNLIVAGATDYVQGDPVPYGITSTLKLAHVAEGMGLDIEYHAPGPVQRHMMAATRNTNYYETSWVDPDTHLQPPIYKDGYEDGLYVISEDGCVSVPEGPGLGMEYDWDWIMRHRTGGREYTA